jgi:hypothetical protein
MNYPWDKRVCTSIIDVGLLRPAAAPGGRRVDGSRLGVAMMHML